jgi:hypothetical protein
MCQIKQITADSLAVQVLQDLMLVSYELPLPCCWLKAVADLQELTVAQQAQVQQAALLHRALAQ